MLHRINLPACACHLEWIVQLQSDLLHALCDPAINAATVTVEWVQSKCHEVDESWVKRFCGWSKKCKPENISKSMLDRMRGIAALSWTDKQSVIMHYENNLQFEKYFDGLTSQPPVTRPISNGLAGSVQSAYKEFFEMFYSPLLYQQYGYAIDSADLNGKRFVKDIYLAACRTENKDIMVCPFCDGSMDGAEIDHWLAQKHLPELNCHPKNLFEICGACNQDYKGEQLAMDAGTADPFAAWFHPHLRPAAGLFRIEKRRNRVVLISDDPIIQTRLNKLGKIMHLGSRWYNEWTIQSKSAEALVRGVYRRRRIVDDPGLRSKIDDWMNEERDRIGIDAHAIIRTCFWETAQDPTTNEAIELHAYLTEERNR